MSRFDLFIALVVFCLAPFIWTFLTSLKGRARRSTTCRSAICPIRSIWGTTGRSSHYERFRWSLLNSAIVATARRRSRCRSARFCAYAVARLDFPGKNSPVGAGPGDLDVPGIAIIGPLFRQFNDWGLTNNYLALILPNVTFTLPICIWTLTAFFRDMPIELEESARVDGCTRMQTFFKIVAPLAAPGVFTAAILLFIQAWNEFLFARTFMSRADGDRDGRHRPVRGG